MNRPLFGNRRAEPQGTQTEDASRSVLTVTEVNQRARLLLERSFSTLMVVGEISNYKQSGGHHYFNLKDKSSVLPAVLFRREAMRLRFALRPGLEVVATGRLTLYSPYGRYQMVLDHVEPKGAGALQAAFVQLKEKLGAEGLFDQERKRSLPLLPRRVGVITSPTGSVIRDIVNVATRRFPNANIVVFPTRVQGAESAPNIAAALGRASALADALELDALIVARGGGSLEELWGFNEEVVARAIAASAVPVVSAVGHETDFTISDFVADHRAPTPSAAAELVFPIKSELNEAVRRQLARSAVAVRRGIEHRRVKAESLRARLGDGRRVVREGYQRLSGVQARLCSAARQGVMTRRLRLNQSVRRLERSHPRVRVQGLKAAMNHARGRIVLLMRNQLGAKHEQLGGMGRRLNALSPLGVLDRGYSIVLDKAGSAVRDAADVSPGDKVSIRLARGQIDATVD